MHKNNSSINLEFQQHISNSFLDFQTAVPDHHILLEHKVNQDFFISNKPQRGHHCYLSKTHEREYNFEIKKLE